MDEMKKEPMYMKISKPELLSILRDHDYGFTRQMLERIIDNEFFNDDNPLDDDIIDAAIARILALEGTFPDASAMQRERERIAYGVVRRVLFQSH